uniref:Uncharacterized protein n=1 Tax=Knipowitschia caucasica TaxID=637954 RepID=A0AAV2IXM0_KNICA
MKEQFTKDFSARYTYLQDLLYSASALDPRFKDLSFLDDSDTTKDMVFMKITTAVLKMSDMVLDEDVPAEEDNRSPKSEEDDTDHSPPKKKTALDQMFGDLQCQRVQKKTIQDRAKEEILNKPSDAVMEGPCSPEHAAVLTDSILNMLVTDMRPLSMVDDVGFKAMIATFQPNYVLPTQTYLTKRLEEKFEELRAKMKTAQREADTAALTVVCKKED